MSPGDRQYARARARAFLGIPVDAPHGSAQLASRHRRDDLNVNLSQFVAMYRLLCIYRQRSRIRPEQLPALILRQSTNLTLGECADGNSRFPYSFMRNNDE